MHAHLVSKGVIAVFGTYGLKKLSSLLVKHARWSICCECAVWARRLAARRASVELAAHSSLPIVYACGQATSLRSHIFANPQYVGNPLLTLITA